MSLGRLIKNNLCFYRSISIGIFLAVAVATAVLTGAMLVGDSVSQSLKMIAESRLGKTEFALRTYNKPFTEQLAGDLSKKLNTNFAGLLKLNGLISNGDGSNRINRVEIIGVDERFFNIGSAPDLFKNNMGVILNTSLAKKLSFTDSKEVLLRIEKPSAVSRDIPLTPDSDLTVTLRANVIDIADNDSFGNFSLLSNHLAPLNVFVPLKRLQKTLGLDGQINTILIANNSSLNITLDKINLALKQSIKLIDMGLTLENIPNEYIELQSKNIFFDDTIAAGAFASGNDPRGILTYFVNELKLNGRSTPYSFVSAIQKSNNSVLIPHDLADNEIVINRWLAGDLDAKIGSTIQLNYFVIGSGRNLLEKTSSFTVKKILPMQTPGLNALLTPNFPGLADKQNCRDWDPGIPIDLDNIRDKDEDYWAKFNAAPKALITLSAGKKIWPNRFGTITAIRYPLGINSPKEIEEELLNNIEPASAGFYFQPVKQLAQAAYEQSTDFGQLFLGLSFFLIISAAVLLSLVFTFGVERRSTQIGFLLAAGFTHKQIKRLFFLEAAVLIFLGTAAGSGLAVLYTKTMIFGLKTIWQDALAGSVIYFHANTSTIVTGAVVSIVISSVAVWLSLRKHLRRPARELLCGNTDAVSMRKTTSQRKKSLYISGASFIAAVVVLFASASVKASAAAALFFLCGALILTSILSLIHSLLIAAAGPSRSPMHSIMTLALRNASRRSSRSVAVIGLISIGSFLVIATGANRHDPTTQAKLRSSGTGGFSIYAETAIPILNDLNNPSQHKLTGLDQNVKFVQMRANNGDDASCLNLNRAQRPRLLGVNPSDMIERNAFTFLKTIDKDSDPSWDVLNMKFQENVIPAIADYATITWALGKSIGEDIEYIDEQGRGFKLRIVGVLKDSVFQGSLLINTVEFEKRFPSQQGYKVMLVDTDTAKTDFVMDTLSRNLADFAIDLTGTSQRLARFKTVEHTYLSIFQLLGGLALILGSVGLGLVVLLNILDRRAELAMIRAVGFSIKSTKLTIFIEHTALMLAGLITGSVAAVIAVFPVIIDSASQIPFLSLMGIISCIAASALVWIYFATSTALRGPLLNALRNE